MRDDFNGVCTLISVTETSVNGILTTTETSRTVFCSLISNIHTVKASADTNAVGYEIKLKLPDVSEYSGEQYVTYDGNRYEITRTYQDGYMLEITCVRGVR